MQRILIERSPAILCCRMSELTEIEHNGELNIQIGAPVWCNKFMILRSDGPENGLLFAGWADKSGKIDARICIGAVIDGKGIGRDELKEMLLCEAVQEMR